MPAVPRPDSPLSPLVEHASLAVMQTPAPVNHVFVDFENVHEIDPATFASKAINLTLLLGPAAKKLDIAIVEQFVAHAAAVHFIRLETKGKNAVDFALAYYLGQAVLADPTGYFHIISKDKGYDPLVEHLKTKKRHVHRHDSFASLLATIQPKPVHTPGSTLAPNPSSGAVAPQKTESQSHAPAKPPVLPAPKPQPPKPSLSEAAEHLRINLAGSISRPLTRKTLTRHAITVLGNKHSEEEVNAIIKMLCTANKIAINAQDKVEYRFPAATTPKSPA